MIQANELRIGNIISNGYFNIRVNHIATDMYGACEGIPLTSNILERMGFEKISGNYEKGVLFVGSDMNVELYSLVYGEMPIRLPHIKYLHQLQNLAHIVTGEELNYQP